MFHLGQIENTNIFKTNIVQMYTQFICVDFRLIFSIFLFFYFKKELNSI